MAHRSPWLTPEQQAVWRTWMGLRSSLPNALNRQLAAASALSLADYEVLVCLSESSQGRLRVSDLAQVMGWERSRLSHQLRRMQERGLIERLDCASDGRVAHVALSCEGRRAIDAAAPGHAQTVRELVFDGSSDDELAVVAAFLDRLTDRLGDAEQPPAGPC